MTCGEPAKDSSLVSIPIPSISNGIHDLGDTDEALDELWQDALPRGPPCPLLVKRSLL